MLFFGCNAKLSKNCQIQTYLRLFFIKYLIFLSSLLAEFVIIQFFLYNLAKEHKLGQIFIPTRVYK